MNETEARQQMTDCLERLKGDFEHAPPQGWLSETPLLCELPTGDWLATHPEDSHEGLLLKTDGTTIPFHGALGKLVREFHLGVPASREYLLASASRGRYQMLEHGLAVWEKFDTARDIGYPVATWKSTNDRARSCDALVAFFDLRGFTAWSKDPNVDAKAIQQVIEALEISFQDAFDRKWCKKLFAKGTGDGFMVVSEMEWYGASTVSASIFRSGHVNAFCRACAETVKNCISRLPDKLAVGCGITCGNITQLYLLGRYDYIGPRVNEASKIQATAYNELCISSEVVDHLQWDKVKVQGKTLPGKGFRVPYEFFTDNA